VTYVTAAHALVETLRRSGVRVIFGYPGGHTVYLHDALAAARDDIRHILVRHEQAAAMAADAYGRITGGVGLCLTTAGPGATNAATGIAEAYSDCTALVQLVAQVDSTFLGRERGAYHEADLDRLFRPITKWCATARSPREIPHLVARAISEARRGRPRPVQLSLPRDLTAEPVTLDPPVASMDQPRPLPAAQNLAQACELLRGAERPVLFAGGGVLAGRACDQLAALAEHLGAPVITSAMGKGVLPEDHPLAAGHAHTAPARELAAQADVMLAVGTRFTEVTTHAWSFPVPTRLIHLDIDPTPFAQTYPPAVSLLGDARATLQALLAELPANPDRAERLAAKLAPLWASYRASVADEPEHVFLRLLRAALPRDTIVCCDVGMITYTMYGHFPVYGPQQMLTAAAYIAMGWGLPAALGAKVAAPDRPVVAVTGDGGFLMTAQELATLVQEHLPVVVVLVNDDCLGTIAGIQERRFDGRRFAVDLKNPDFVQLAGSFGVPAERLTQMEAVAPALDRALSAGSPYLLEVKCSALGF